MNILGLVLLQSIAIVISAINIQSNSHYRYSFGPGFDRIFGRRDSLLESDLFSRDIALSSWNERNKDFSQSYFGCVNYFGSEIDQSSQRIIYSSQKNNIICTITDITQGDAVELLDSVDFHSKFRPVPHLTKLEQTALEVVEDIHRKSDAPMTSRLLSDTNSVVQLSIVFRSRMEKQNSKRLVRQLIQDAVETGRQAYSNTIKSKAKFELEGAASYLDSVGHEKFLDEVFQRSSAPFQESFVMDANDFQSRDIWTIFRDTMVSWNGSVSCSMFESLTDKSIYRSRNVLIPLPMTDIASDKSHAQCFVALLDSLSRSYLVSKIGLTRPIRLQNNIARAVVQSSTTTSTPLYDVGINGTGVIVGISDTGIDENSCYFRDANLGKVRRSSSSRPFYDMRYRKVIEYISYSESGGDYNSGHGSHVAGIVAGRCYDSSNEDGMKFNGMAPAAKLAFFDIGMADAAQSLVVPADMSEIFDTAVFAGASIHSNSWGGSYWYDSFSIETDQYLFENPEFAVFFAGGNDGSTGYQSVLSPALAKNAIAVAATENPRGTGHMDSIAYFSSYGPAPDGRIKPDIAAPGYSIMSAKAADERSSGTTCDHTLKAGTSMATPVLAGNAALITQYFADDRFWKTLCNPSYPMCNQGSFKIKGSALKAVILNSGQMCDVHHATNVHLTTIPDVFQGYGRAQLSAALPLQHHGQSSFDLFVHEVSLADFSEVTLQFHVTKTNIPLKVTISWYDPPADVFAAKVLVNDIDLVVTSPNGDVFFGNSFSIADSNLVPTANVRDEVNNNEQVIVSTPALGAWTVKVQSKRIFSISEQMVSIVGTLAGEVSAQDDNWNKVDSIDPSSFSECSSSSQTSIDIALWSLPIHRGWDSTTKYSIIDKSLTTHITGGFDSIYFFDSVSTCLPLGEFSMDFTTTQSTYIGSQVSIPECNIYLTPLNPRDSFYLFDDPLDGAMSKPLCVSKCMANDHFSLPLYKVEEAGEGWKGSYFSIQSISGHSTSIAERSIAAGTLDWGFDEYQEVCLPMKSQCYYIELSQPYLVDYFPWMYLPGAEQLEVWDDVSNSWIKVRSGKPCHNAIRYNESLAMMCIDSNSMVGNITFYAQRHSMSNFGQSHATWFNVTSLFTPENSIKLGSCSFTVEMGMGIDVNPEVDVTDAPTLAPVNSPTAAPTSSPVPNPTEAPSQAPSQQPTLSPTAAPSTAPIKGNNATNSIQPTLNPTASPTPLPTKTSSPSFAPTIQPTVSPTPRPSAEPTYTPTIWPATASETNLTCFQSCSMFANINSTYDYESICDMLAAEAFLDCNSFALANNLCRPGPCATTCAKDTLCYYGAMMVFGCFSLGGPVQPNFTTYLDTCKKNSLVLGPSTGYDDDGSTEVFASHSSGSKNLSLVVFETFLIVLFGIACVGIMWAFVMYSRTGKWDHIHISRVVEIVENWKHRGHERLSVDSKHGNSEHDRSESEHGEVEITLSPMYRSEQSNA